MWQPMNLARFLAAVAKENYQIWILMSLYYSSPFEYQIGIIWLTTQVCYTGIITADSLLPSSVLRPMGSLRDINLYRELR